MHLMVQYLKNPHYRLHEHHELNAGPLYDTCELSKTRLCLLLDLEPFKNYKMIPMIRWRRLRGPLCDLSD